MDRFKKMISLWLAIAISLGSFPLNGFVIAVRAESPFSVSFDKWTNQLYFSDSVPLPIELKLGIAGSRNGDEPGALLWQEDLTVTGKKYNISSIIKQITEATLLHIYLIPEGSSESTDRIWATPPEGTPSISYVYPPKNISVISQDNDHVLVNWEYGSSDYNVSNSTHFYSVDNKNWEETTLCSCLVPLSSTSESFYIKTRYKGNESEVVSVPLANQSEIHLTLYPQTPLAEDMVVMVGDYPAQKVDDVYQLSLPEGGTYPFTIQDDAFDDYVVSPNSLTVTESAEIPFSILGTNISFVEPLVLKQEESDLMKGRLEFLMLEDADTYHLSYSGQVESVKDSPVLLDFGSFSLGETLAVFVTPIRKGYQGVTSEATLTLEGELSGTVTLNGEKLAGATVTMGQHMTTTDSKGEFCFRKLSEGGEQVLLVEYEGLRQEIPITVQQIYTRLEVPLAGGGRIKGKIPDASAINIKNPQGKTIENLSVSSEGAFCSAILPFGEYILTATNQDHLQSVILPYTLDENLVPIDAELLDGTLYSFYLPTDESYKLTLYDEKGGGVEALGQQHYPNGQVELVAKNPIFLTVEGPRKSGVATVDASQPFIVSTIEGRLQTLQPPIAIRTVEFYDMVLPMVSLTENRLILVIPPKTGGLLLQGANGRGMVPVDNGIPKTEQAVYTTGWLLEGTVSAQHGKVSLYHPEGYPVASATVVEGQFILPVTEAGDHWVLAFKSETHVAIQGVSTPTKGFLPDVVLSAEVGSLACLQLKGVNREEVSSLSVESFLLPNLTPTEDKQPFIMLEETVFLGLKNTSQLLYLKAGQQISALLYQDHSFRSLDGTPLLLNLYQIPMTALSESALLLGRVELPKDSIGDVELHYGGIHYPILEKGYYGTLLPRSLKVHTLIFSSKTHSGVENILLDSEKTLYIKTDQPLPLYEGRVVYGQVNHSQMQGGEVTLYNKRFEVLDKVSLSRDGSFTLIGVTQEAAVLSVSLFTANGNTTALTQLNEGEILLEEADFYEGELFSLEVSGLEEQEALFATHCIDDKAIAIPILQQGDRVLLVGREGQPIVLHTATKSCGKILSQNEQYPLKFGQTIVVKVGELPVQVEVRDNGTATNLEDRLPIVNYNQRQDLLFIHNLPQSNSSYTLFFSEDQRLAVTSIDGKPTVTYLPNISLQQGKLLYGRIQNVLPIDPSPEVWVYSKKGELLGQGLTTFGGYYELALSISDEPYYTYLSQGERSQIEFSFLNDGDFVYQPPVILEQGEKVILPFTNSDSQKINLSLYEPNGKEQTNFTVTQHPNAMVLSTLAEEGEYLAVLSYQKSDQIYSALARGHIQKDGPNLWGDAVFEKGSILYGSTAPSAQITMQGDRIYTLKADDDGSFFIKGIEEKLDMVLLAEGVGNTGGTIIPCSTNQPFYWIKQLDLKKGHIVTVQSPEADRVNLDTMLGLKDGYGIHYFTGVSVGEALLTAEGMIDSLPFSGCSFVEIVENQNKISLPLIAGRLLYGVVESSEVQRMTLLNRKDQIIATTKSHASGAFAVAGVPDEPILVLAEGESTSCLLSWNKNQNPSDPYKLLLKSMSGRLVGGRLTGKGVGECRIVCFDEAGMTLQGETTDFSYYLAGVQQGGLVSASQSQRTAIGKLGEPLHLSEGELYSGEVSYPEGYDGKLQVTLVDPSFRTLQTAYCDAFGRYVLKGTGQEAVFTLETADMQQSHSYGELLTGDTPRENRKISLQPGEIVMGRLSEGSGIATLGEERRKTNKEGIFLFNGIPSGGYYLKGETATKQGYTYYQTRQSPHIIPLQEQPLLQTTVTDEEGVPLKMTVTTIPKSGEPAFYSISSMTTDAHGRLLWEKEKYKNMLLALEGQGYSAILDGAVMREKMIAEKGSLYRAILQSAEGTLLSNGAVFLQGKKLLTNAGGEVVASGINAETFPITVLWNGDLYQGDGDLKDGQVALQKSSAQITGVVTDHGSGIAGGEIELYSLPDLQPLCAREIISDGNGVFAIPETNFTGKAILTVAYKGHVAFQTIELVAGRKEVLSQFVPSNGQLIVGRLTQDSKATTVYANGYSLVVEDGLFMGIIPEAIEKLILTNERSETATLSLVPHQSIHLLGEPVFSLLPYESCQIVFSDGTPVTGGKVLLKSVEGEEISTHSLEESGIFTRPPIAMNRILEAEISGKGVEYSTILFPTMNKITIPAQEVSIAFVYSSRKDILGGEILLGEDGIRLQIMDSKIHIPSLSYGIHPIEIRPLGDEPLQGELIIDAEGWRFKDQEGIVHTEKILLPLPKELLAVEALMSQLPSEDLAVEAQLLLALATISPQRLLLLSDEILAKLEQHLERIIKINQSFSTDVITDTPSILSLLPFQEITQLIPYLKGQAKLTISWLHTGTAIPTLPEGYKGIEAFTLTPYLFLEGLLAENGNATSHFYEEIYPPNEFTSSLHVSYPDFLLVYDNERLVGCYAEGSSLVPWQEGYRYCLAVAEEILPPLPPDNGSSSGSGGGMGQMPPWWIGHYERLEQLLEGSRYSFNVGLRTPIPPEILDFLYPPTSMTLIINGLVITPLDAENIPQGIPLTLKELQSFMSASPPMILPENQVNSKPVAITPTPPSQQSSQVISSLSESDPELPQEESKIAKDNPFFNRYHYLFFDCCRIIAELYCKARYPIFN